MSHGALLTLDGSEGDERSYGSIESFELNNAVFIFCSLTTVTSEHTVVIREHPLMDLIRLISSFVKAG